MEWFEAVELIRPYVVKISTPSCSGTGFLISLSKDKTICGIATAAHVIRHAHSWEQPIRIQHDESRKSIVLKPEKRAIWLGDSNDAAAIIFICEEIPFPQDSLGLPPEDRYLKIGNEVGWLGFPALSPDNLCFFIGRISSYLQGESAYLVDGVAINGVSGGPAFIPEGDESITIIGIITAYIPNWATGEALPGLCLVTDIEHFYSAIRALKSLDDAKQEEDQSLSHGETDTGDKVSSA